MASETDRSELVELRPAPAVLLRHRDADLDVHTAPRTGPRVELRRGALWIRAGEEGPGVTVTHGAATVQVRAGAGVVEVSDMEALLVVASGRAAVKGVSPLPRSVIAGQAVTLTLDGTFSDPDALSAAELAADRMVVENLALDSLASVAGPGGSAVPTAAPEPAADTEGLPTRTPGATTAARTDLPRAPIIEPTGDPFAPRVRPEGEPEATEPAAPVGRPAPSLPPETEPSALEAALANVGVTDAPPDPVEALAPPPSPPAPTRSLPVLGRTADDGGLAPPPPRPAMPTIGQTPEAAPAPEAPPGRKAMKVAPEMIPGTDVAASSPDEDATADRRRQRILIALVIGALIVLAIVAALAFNSDPASAASAL